MPDKANRDRIEPIIDRLSEAVGASVDPDVVLSHESSVAPGDVGFESTGSGSSGVVARMRSRPSLSSRYRFEGEIARGGMGAILEVWDEDLRRRLAMKVALGEGEESSPHSAEKLDPRLLSRFLEEAQVTGQLEHPGIVPVHELGIDDNGVVFFTMQLVRGRDLEEVFQLVADGVDGWSVTRALGALLKVCEAMAFAHSKGVIHRDLKPSNVMVGHFGEVYVMDWGLVRVQGREDRHDVRVADGGGVDTDVRTDTASGSSDGLYTMDGDVVGTPAFMSPEQGCGNIESLDARTDVYSVGAMMYRLLAGFSPYCRKGEPQLRAHEILLALRKGPPPALAELASDAPAEIVAIAEKAMARDAAERYADMQGLADDLRAYLENRVVQAYRSGAVAEARMWVRRNRSLAASIACGLLVLVAGLVASLVLKEKSDQSAERASRQASIAREVADFLNEDLLATIAPDQEGVDVTVREVLAIGSVRLDGRFGDEPLVEAELRRTIGTSFERLGEYETARGHLERAHELLVAQYGEQSVAALSTALRVGSVWTDLGRFDDALVLCGRSIELCEEELGPFDVLTLYFRSKVAETYRASGDLDRSIGLFAELDEIARRELGDRHDLTLSVLTRYSEVLSELGRLEHAEGLQVEALEAYREMFGDRDPRTLEAADGLGETLVALGRLAEAEELLLRTQEAREAVLGKDHPATGTGYGRLGLHYFVQGRHAEAEEYIARGYETLRRSLGSEHHLALQMASNLASVWSGLGRDERALELREATLETQRRTLGEEHPNTILSICNLANGLQALGRYEEAEAAHRKAIALREKVFGADHPDTWSALENYSGLLLQQGKDAESIELTTRVLEGRKRTLGSEHPSVARSLYNLGIANLNRDDVMARNRFEKALAVGRASGAGDVVANALAEIAGITRNEGDLAGAKVGYLEAVSAWREFGVDDLSVANWLHLAGSCAYAQKEYDEAAEVTGEGLALRRTLLGSKHETTLGSMVATARCLLGGRRFEEAEERMLEIHELVLEKDGARSSRVRNARKLLGQLYDAWGRPEEAERWR